MASLKNRTVFLLLKILSFLKKILLFFVCEKFGFLRKIFFLKKSYWGTVWWGGGGVSGDS